MERSQVWGARQTVRLADWQYHQLTPLYHHLQLTLIIDLNRPSRVALCPLTINYQTEKIDAPSGAEFPKYIRIFSTQFVLLLTPALAYCACQPDFLMLLLQSYS